MYAARSLFVSGLLIALYFVYQSQVAGRPRVNDLAAHARVGQAFCQMIIGAQLGLVLLIVPAFTAGAVCTQKVQGSLLHLFVTDLSNAEIILGKLAARLVPVIGLIGCSLPILFLSTLFGGIEPRSLVGAFLVLLAVAIFSCCLTLAFSVWAKRTYEVVIASYFTWALLLFPHLIWSSISWYWDLGYRDLFKNLDLNPFPIAFAPFGASQPSLAEPLVYLLACLTISTGLIALAIASVRAFGVRELARPARTRNWMRKLPTLRGWKDRLPSPSLDDHPVAWREWRGSRTVTWVRLAWSIYGVLTLILLVKALDWAISTHRWSTYSFDDSWGERLFYVMTGRVEPSRFLALQVGIIVGIGLFLVSLTSVTSLAEERARGSLEFLLVTPLPSSTIIKDKWWSSYRAVIGLVIPPLLLVAAQLWLDGNWFGTLLFIGLVLAYGATLVSLALGLATWICTPTRAVTATAIISLLLLLSGVLIVTLVFGETPPQLRLDNWGHRAPVIHSRVDDLLGYAPQNCHKEVVSYALVIGICVLMHFCFLLRTIASFDRCVGRMGARHPAGPDFREAVPTPEPIAPTSMSR